MVGGELLKLLGGDGRYAHVVSLVRRALVTTEPIENRVVSFEDLDRYTLPDVDDAYCCLGTTRRAAGSDEAFRRVDLDYVLGYPTRNAAVPASTSPASRRRRASCKRTCFWNWSGARAVVALNSWRSAETLIRLARASASMSIGRSK